MVETIQVLEERSIRKVLGKVEIETIIKKIKKAKLKQTERNYLSRSIRPKLKAAQMLSDGNLLEKINKTKSDEREIIYNLLRYGYELISPGEIGKRKKISIYDLIAKILIREPKPRFIEAIPILMIKNDINFFALLEMSVKYNLKNKVGYLLETSLLIERELKIKKSEELVDLLEYLEGDKEEETSFLGEEEGEEEYKNFMEKTSPKRIKKWNLLGRFFDKDFIENAKAYLK